MVDRERWNWDTGKKLVCDLRAIEGRFYQVHEWVVSPDGESIAAPVLTGPEVFRISVNGELWDGEFEKAWHLVFAPDGPLTALVRIDDEWTVAIDGVTWEERWEFAWNPTFNRDGSVLAVQIKDNMQYTVAVNGRPWEQRFHSSRGLAVSEDGHRVAALVQVEPLAEGDIFGFMEGTWSVAVDGTPWERKFINVYGPAISSDGEHVAAEVRLDICDYTLAEDAKTWESRFGCVWEPTYRPNGRGWWRRSFKRVLDHRRERQPDLGLPIHAALEPAAEPGWRAYCGDRGDELWQLDGCRRRSSVARVIR